MDRVFIYFLSLFVVIRLISTIRCYVLHCYSRVYILDFIISSPHRLSSVEVCALAGSSHEIVFGVVQIGAKECVVSETPIAEYVS